MLVRCNKPNSKNYARYGGRGIKVEFQNFKEFFNEVGPRPPATTIDRIDNNGNYAPGNVRWADWRTQTGNRSDNHPLTHRGKTQPLFEWAAEVGLPMRTLWARIMKYGWTTERALETPKQALSEISRAGHAVRWGK